MKILISLLLVVIFQSSFAQNVGVGITTPLSKLHVYNGASGALPHLSAALAVESNGNVYMNFLSPASKESGVFFGQPANAAHGAIVYNNATTLNGLQFRTNSNSTGMVITENGNVGIGLPSPAVKLHVIGMIASQGLQTGAVTMGSLQLAMPGQVSDFLVMTDPSGLVGYRKGHGGTGLNYMIATQGVAPSTTPPFQGGQTYIGEIKIFAGTNAPFGWMLCNGQLLSVAANPGLFSVIGYTYGGDGSVVFALPDMQSRTAVGAGDTWVLGEAP